MLFRRITHSLIGFIVFSISAGGLTACGPASNSSDSSNVQQSYNPVSVSGTAPGGDLIPTNSEESGKKSIVWLIFDGLVRVDPDTSKVVNEVADSITSKDLKKWTIKIKSGEKFSDGSPVTSDSFIDAWTWGAKVENAQIASADLSIIKGYDRLHPTTGGKSITGTFDGLQKIDNHTFTVELTSKNSSFIDLLTSVTFLPLPKSFFKNPDAWRKNPVGNGPYKLKGKVDEATGVYLDVNKNYTGSRKPHNTGIYIRFYTDSSAAYQDVLSDNLDITSPGGADLLTAAKDFGNRLVKPKLTGPNTTLTFPLWDSYWKSDRGLKVRQAISLSINRQEIINKVLNGYAVPARDFTVKGLQGWKDNIPGSDILDYNPSKAKKLLREAGGYTKDLPIYYNADGAHKQWVEAVANQIKTNLGINAIATPVATFSDYLAQRGKHVFKGPFRASEIPFNPGLDDMLRNVYSDNGSSNSGSEWHSQEFEDLLKQGWEQTSTVKADEYFNKAQEVLLNELPAIPLWYSTSPTVHSTLVSNVKSTFFGSTLYLVEKKAK